MYTYKNFRILLFTGFIFNLAYCSVPPLSKCKGSDTKCITQSSKNLMPYFVKGFSEIGVPNLETLHFDFVNASTAGIKMLIYNITLMGQENCNILRMARDAQHSKLLLEMQCDMELTGQLEMDGKFITIPMRGKGDCYMKARDYRLKIEYDVKDYTGKDGKNHWKVTGWTFTCQVLGNSKIHLANFFGDNESLNAALNQALNANVNVLLDSICAPLTEAAARTDVKNINKFFHHFSVDELSLD